VFDIRREDTVRPVRGRSQLIIKQFHAGAGTEGRLRRLPFEPITPTPRWAPAEPRRSGVAVARAPLDEIEVQEAHG
jgi:hypothetical protein